MADRQLPSDFTAAAGRALNLTGRLINHYGPRPAGSDESRGTADALKAEATPFADAAWTEDFPVHPGAFLGWIRILVLLYLMSVLLLWLELYLPAALLVTLGLGIMVGQFFFYREVIDRLYPRRTGRNVLASLEPVGEVRGQLIISGHHDSAQVFNFLAHQPALYPLRVMGGIGTLVLLFLVSWTLWIWLIASGTTPGWGTYAAGLFSLLFLLVGQLWWFASAKSTPGAGDNLASSAAAWEALREMAGRKSRGGGLSYLRLVAASWDAEEAGLRGSRFWVSKQAGGRLDLPTWNLNLECLYNTEDFFFLTSDVNGSVQLSADLAARCQRLLAKQGHIVPANTIAFLTGGTDAGELARGGVEATSLIGMPWGNSTRSSVYHTPDDVLDAVSVDAIIAAIQLAVDLAEDLDKLLVGDGGPGQ